MPVIEVGGSAQQLDRGRSGACLIIVKAHRQRPVTPSRLCLAQTAGLAGVWCLRELRSA